MFGHRTVRTCRNGVAVVSAFAVPTGCEETHHATARAANWDLSGAWQAGTAVSSLSRTDYKISRCFEQAPVDSVDDEPTG